MHSLCFGVPCHRAVLLLGMFISLALADSPAFAQSAQISLQGRLTDPGGSPIEGPVNLTVRLYTGSVGGAPLFSETHSGVPLVDGVYSINMGSINSSSMAALDFGREIWLGIQVNSDSELSPRTLFTAAPTARTLTLPAEMRGTASTYGATTLVIHNEATTGQNYALTTLSDSPNGRAVYGYGTHLTGANYGLYGLSRSTAGVGTRGRASATSGSTIGVEGVADSPSGVGVNGEGGVSGVDGSGTHGGRFVGTSNGILAQGASTGALVSGGVGLKATADVGSGSDIVLGGNSFGSAVGRITSDPTYTSSSIEMKSNSNVDMVMGEAGTFTILDQGSHNRLEIDDVDISLYLDPHDVTAQFALLRIFTPLGNVFQVDEAGNTHVEGALVVAGAKNARVETRSFGDRLVYSIESPEVWFEDFGTATLVRGSARVDLDPVFLETVTVSPAYPMKVFLQPTGPTTGLYARKNETGFTVFEQEGGEGSVTFDYRVVAKRKGFESERLEQSTPTTGITPD